MISFLKRLVHGLLKFLDEANDRFKSESKNKLSKTDKGTSHYYNNYHHHNHHFTPKNLLEELFKQDKAGLDIRSLRFLRLRYLYMKNVLFKNNESLNNNP